MDGLRDFWQEIRDHWDDHYWWMRHPELQIMLLSVISGVIGLLFAWLETRIRIAAVD